MSYQHGEDRGGENIEDMFQYMGQDGYLVHPSGIKYMPEYGKGAQSSMQCFGTLMNKPNIKSSADYRRAIENLDVVESRKVWVGDSNGVPEEVDGWQGIVSTKTGQVYSIPTDEYDIVQDSQIFEPLVDVLDEHDWNVMGDFHGVGTGRTRATLFVHDPNFVIQLLNEYKDSIMVGVRLTNSYDRMRKYGFDVISVRMICCNFGIWGDLALSKKFKHIESKETMVLEYGTYMERLIDKSEILRNTVNLAEQTVLKPDEVHDILWGLGMPINGIDEILENPVKFMPEWRGPEIDAYELNAMAEAMITYKAHKSFDRVEFLTEQAGKILNIKEHDRLIDAGRKAFKAYKDNEKKRQDASEKRKNMEPPMVVRQVA